MGDPNLTDLRKQCLSSLYSCTENVSKYLGVESSEYEGMKLCVKEYCMMEAREAVAAQALEKAKGEIDASNVDSLDTKFESHLRIMAKNSLQSVDGHPYMLEFKKRVEKGMQSPISNLDDSEIEITESQTTYNDPFTKKAIEDPVRNSLCGHIYEKEVIMNIIQKRKKGIKCPVVGCGNQNLIKAKHLISDDELKLKMMPTYHSTMVKEHSIMELTDSAQ